MNLTILQASDWLATQQIGHEIIRDCSPTIVVPEHQAMIFKDPNGSTLMWFTPLFNRAMPLLGLEAIHKALELTVALDLVKKLQDRHRASVAPAIDPEPQPFHLRN